MQSPQTFSDWLQQALPQYERLAETVVSLLTSIMKKKKIAYLSIEGRPKTLASAVEKAKRKGYSKPQEQMTDLAGIRVVTFLEEQVRDVVSAIEELFEVDHENSRDRAQSLGHDRMGYRSTHFVCTLGSRRGVLPEYEALGSLKFEVQLRTVLQHAWAELAHDRSFKFKTVLPVHLQRKLNLYSGLLEVVDSGFDQIAAEIDQYQSTIDAAPAEQLSQAEIDSISIERFFAMLKKRFDLDIHKSVPGNGLADAIEELKSFGISNIGELESLLNIELVERHKKFLKEDTDVGFLRSLMMYTDIDKYLRTWSPKRWSAIERSDFDFLASKYGPGRVAKAFKNNEITLLEDDEDEYQEDED